MKQYLEAGKIINIHGFRGTLKAESWCDTPKILASLKTVYLLKGDRYLPFNVRRGSVSGKFVLLTLSGVETEEEANALRGSVVYASRDDIPKKEGEAFLADMIGLPVIDAESGARYGTLTDVEEGVASRLYVIATQSGTVLMPEVKQFIARIDIKQGIFVTPIPGMFDGNAEIVQD